MNKHSASEGNASSALAHAILEHARETMLVDLRFLEPAFSQMEFAECEGTLLSVDGERVYFDPDFVVSSFAQEPHRITRDYLHMVLHCLFRHPFSAPTFSPAHWDLACDMAIEGCISDLGMSDVTCERESHQRALFARLTAGLPYVTAETLYYRLIEEGVTEEQAIEYRRAFFVDDHAFWQRGRSLNRKNPASGGQDALERSSEEIAPPSERATAAHSSCEDAPLEDDSAGAPPFCDDALASMVMAMASGGTAESDGDLQRAYGAGGVPSPDVVSAGRPEAQQRTLVDPRDSFDTSLRDRWREISLRADVSLDDFSQLWGAFGGEFSMALKRSNVERVDYGEFLRRFVSRDEQMSINDDEFDYVYYCYGLELFGTMPLIEPLEYTDDGRIRDFVIAIDTSASTKGDAVASFVERTYDILHDAGVFSDRLNLFLIQCDAQIQDVVRIRSRADVEAYVSGLELKGFGGTDFRPVFAYVDELVASGELAHMKGLLYFTDGQGAYPRVAPHYDVAFVLTDSAFVNEPDVPPWAMRVRIDSGEFCSGVKGEPR